MNNRRAPIITLVRGHSISGCGDSARVVRFNFNIVTVRVSDTVSSAAAEIYAMCTAHMGTATMDIVALNYVFPARVWSSMISSDLRAAG